MNDTSDPILTLRAGVLVLDLAPAVGGIIAGFRHGDSLLMRAPDLDAIRRGSPRGGASWPLVPYSNRIRDGRFPWRGRIFTLAKDVLSTDHAIHGNGWRRPWSTHERSESGVRLKQVHAGDAFWPFAYEAQQAFALTPRGFTLWMAVTNTGDGPMPAGLGHHPYFHRSDDVRLRVAAREMWDADEQRFPVKRVTVPAAMDFSADRAVASASGDAVFVGWERPARITWPAARLALDIDAGAIYDRLVVFIPPGQPSFAVEPVSHDTDAVNRPKEDSGLRTLAPGETLEGEMKFTVLPL
jgi:aldose 1-epimerase